MPKTETGANAEVFFSGGAKHNNKHQYNKQHQRDK